MSIKSYVRGALVATLLMLPLATRGNTTGSGSGLTGAVDTTVNVTETVDTFAEWDAGSGSATLNVADHITDLAQHSGTVDLHLYTNANAPDGTVKVTVAPAADTNGNATGILKNAAGTVSLQTWYMLTGAGLNAPDSSFKVAGTGSGEFFEAGIQYILKNGAVASNDYLITLNVQAQAASNSAPPATTYKAAVTVTASW